MDANRVDLKQKKILIIDDEMDICNLLKEVLNDEGAETYSTQDGESALQFLKENQVDCVVSDVWMPKIDGISLISEIRSLKDCENLPIIMMSGHGTIESAVEATKKGVYDFIEKPLSIERIVLCVQNAIDHYALIQENQRLKKQSAEYVQPIGKSSIFEEQIKKAKELAAVKGIIFIFGESGSGKNTYARFIYDHSSHPGGVFLRFNFDHFIDDFEQLLSEIKAIKEAYLKATLILENFDQLSDKQQNQLFNEINQDENYLFILLAESDQNLNFAVKKQTIHNSLEIKPLRENLDDLDELVRHYTDLITAQEQVSYRRFNLNAQNLLRNYSWPGNVEELVYLIRKLLVIGGSVQIEADELEKYLNDQQSKISKRNLMASDGDQNDSAYLDIDFDEPLRQSREQFEAKYLLYHLKKVKGNISKLAAITGMERTSIHRKIKQLGINYKDF